MNIGPIKSYKIIICSTQPNVPYHLGGWKHNGKGFCEVKLMIKIADKMEVQIFISLCGYWLGSWGIELPEVSVVSALAKQPCDG